MAPKNFGMKILNFVLFFVILSVHLMEAKVLDFHPSVQHSTSETMGEITKVVSSVDLMEDDDQLVTPKRYSINRSVVTTTNFAIDFCRRISSCFNCIHKKCVYKGYADDNVFYCRHIQDNDLAQNVGGDHPDSYLRTLTTHDDCVQYTKQIENRLNGIDSEEQLMMTMTYLEIAGMFSLILTVITLLVVVGGIIYVKRSLKNHAALSSITFYQSQLPHKTKLMDIK